jgi:hypothetical protein
MALADEDIGAIDVIRVHVPVASGRDALVKSDA